MLRYDIIVGVLLLRVVSENYLLTHSKRKHMSNLHQLLYHIPTQDLDFIHAIKKPTVAHRLNYFVNSMHSKQDSRREHLSITYPNLKKKRRLRRLLYD